MTDGRPHAYTAHAVRRNSVLESTVEETLADEQRQRKLAGWFTSSSRIALPIKSDWNKV